MPGVPEGLTRKTRKSSQLRKKDVRATDPPPLGTETGRLLPSLRRDCCGYGSEEKGITTRKRSQTGHKKTRESHRGEETILRSFPVIRGPGALGKRDARGLGVMG